ncbi:mannose-1-phosphate guanylyltransferase/mannose-6-phosphate isomerase [Enterobacter pasteurii]|uniref:mannose-1-phosphate guanylyltransferase n=1 Tax=Enterobacter cloacae TaxID=550 RepID=A0A7H8UFG3_ENTCL|nr:MULTISPECIES: mannose-1-phosphate guanylyltransferase/mannose-6-phosphate isomerase [Enterobacter cloacae complex]MDE4082920.1 mannose-1-phosphate guanylyltransferase/mannose-6-phosphate isomerase [Enterobacter pasteurii]QKZ98535.1 mannose-1-phosphate guanylyltransferase/mannose-6-phosphate isomerase [Enterobacter cloacae]QLA70010.1 mannose-1-phosphate guanylyltransferase/mannose-6-phosphate isomerase [Enterobacter pasteurii]
MILPVIMAGGVGTRLWPLSRKYFPKQFHNLVSSESLLIDTLKRLEKIKHVPALIVSNEDHRFLVAEQVKNSTSKVSGILLEPEGKNTCPAVALAAFHALKEGMDPLLLVLAADHAIEENDKFIRAINIAQESASKGFLVTFGIVPDRPETGYGYIRKGNDIGSDVYVVNSFKEKPDLDTALSYVSSGEYLWNSGMFMFRASAFLEQLKQYAPDIYECCELSVKNSLRDLDFIRVDHQIFKNCISESVDYAIMEKTDKAVVVPLQAKWNDVGSWAALWELSNKDSSGNYISGDVITNNCTGNYIRSDSSLVATVGVNDHIIVNTKDALLIAHKNHVQDIKAITSILQQKNRPELSYFKNEFRSWGEIERIDTNNNYLVNRITIKPGSKISNQLHYHRNEHWIVVSGTAKIKIDNDYFYLTENESTFIKVGQQHSIMNPGTLPLIIIEVQVGNLISEEDILRMDDK